MPAIRRSTARTLKGKTPSAKPTARNTSGRVLVDLKKRPAGGNLAGIVSREIASVASSRGASTAILDELSAHGFTPQELFMLVVPRRTLARRVSSNERLSPEESDRAVRLARITALAERVFGDDAKAHGWLREPSPMVGNAAPLALLKTETGAQVVEQALHRIDYGMFA